MGENPGCELDLGWINNVVVNTWCVNDAMKEIPKQQCKLHGIHKAAWLLKAVSCIDLTTLSGDDTRSNVTRLCYKARAPVLQGLLSVLAFQKKEPLTTAAVCVYPARVRDAVTAIQNMGASSQISVAAVATGFPSGQYDLTSRLQEIRHSVLQGATEIDVVIDRSLVITGQWDLLYQELQQMKEACGNAEMKTILAVGELCSFVNVYKASLVAMMAGSDFIKTSTGKENVNATLPVSLVMIRAIRDYYQKTGYKVGFKAAGGIRTADDALNWLILIKQELGHDWLNRRLFRIGASALLADIEKHIYYLVHNEIPADYEFTLG